MKIISIIQAYVCLAIIIVLSQAFPAFASDSQEYQDYIVQFDRSFIGKVESAKQLLESKHKSLVLTQGYKKTYNHAISGVVLELSEKEATTLSRLDFVKRVEKDGLVYSSTGWGLDRVNQRLLPLDNNFHRPYQGGGVDIYIVDTGINPNHQEFANRVGVTVSMVSGGPVDCHGHGTHVASIAAGSDVGVASDAIINSLRISNDCDSSAPATAAASDILSAFDWIIQAGNNESVVNYSFTSSFTSISDALENLVNNDFVVATSTGNNNANACTDPGETKPHAVLRVAATTASDTRAGFSNYGSCVDLFAPGDDIIGAYYNSNTGYVNISGTSMASPFVSGIAAAYRQRFPGSSAYEVMEAILDDATPNQVSSTNGAPNLLTFTEIDRPDAYWQSEGVVFFPYPTQGLPRPGCTEGDVGIFKHIGQDDVAMKYRCK